MADTQHFIDTYRDLIVAMPEFVAVGLSKKDIVKRFAPQIKDRRPEEFPAIAIVYDYDKRERWAAIDNLNLNIEIEMKAFDDVQTLSEAIRKKFDRFVYADDTITIYKSFYNGGLPQPDYHVDHQTYFSILIFEISLGGC